MGARASAMTAEGLQNLLNALSQSLGQAGLYAEQKATKARQKQQYGKFYESLFGTGLVPDDRLKSAASPPTSTQAKGIYETPEMRSEDVRVVAERPETNVAAVQAKAPNVAEILRAFASNPDYMDNPLIKALVSPMVQQGTARETETAKAAASVRDQEYESGEAEKERSWKSKEAEEERKLKRELDTKRNSLELRLAGFKKGATSMDKRLDAANAIKSLVTSEEKLIGSQLSYGQISAEEANARRVYLNFLKGPAVDVFREAVGETGKSGLGTEDWGILESAIMALSDPNATEDEKRDAQLIVNSLRTKISGK